MKSSLSRILGVALLFTVTATAAFAPSALASTAHEFEGSFGPDGTSGTEFEWLGPLAVDQVSHDLYVTDLEAGSVYKFDENGAPVNFSALASNEIPGFSFAAGEALNEIGSASTGVLPSQNIYVADYGSNSVKAFAESGAPTNFSEGPGTGTSEIPGFSEVCGVAVDAFGNIYMGDYGAGVHIFSPSGEELTEFSTPAVCNLAVDSAGAVYVSPYVFEGLPLTKFVPSEFPVTTSTTYTSDASVGESSPGAEDGDGVITSTPTYAIAVDPVSDELYAAERLNTLPQESEIVQFAEGGVIASEFAGPGAPGELERSEGVAADGTTGKVFASDSEGERQVEIFAPPPPEPPSVESTTVKDVTTTSATLQAEVNPELFDTHYHFEYVTQVQFEASGFTGATETTETGLGSAGEPQTARSQVAGLAPETTYRFRVIAENENGSAESAEAGKFTTFPITAPGLPDDRAYEMVSPAVKTGEVFPPEPNPLFSGSCERECLPGNLDQQMPMQSSADGEAVLYEGQPFSGGLAAGPNEYLSKRAPSGWGTQSLSTPLFSRNEGQGYSAFSTDLSRGVLYQISPALSPEAPSFEGKGFANLYRREEGGNLQPIITSTPPNRGPGFPTTFNSFQIDYAAANSGSAAAPALSHVVFDANDALTAEVPGTAPAAPAIAASEENLYEWADGELRLINVLPGNTAAAAGAVVGSGNAVSGEGQGADYDGAISADGERIFWSEEASGQVYARIGGTETVKIEDPGKFLVASADGTEVLLSDGCLYEIEAETCEDLSGGEGGFQGILGAAEDLSRVYFVDTAVLTPGEENANEEQAEASEFNLYTWSGGTTKFIGRLLERDNGISGVQPTVGDWRPSSGSRLAQASPDGSYLAFMSRAALTGYDNKRAGESPCFPAPGESAACYEVFEYAAASEELSCASCNPSGEAPLGSSNLSLIFRGKDTKAGFPQPGNLSAEGQGRLFFESLDDLSPFDTNGRTQDVYEWEPEGVGSCERAGGCVSLISSGHSSNDSMFLNATPSGDDAFFVTRERLLAPDKDERLDLYDARVGGGILEAAPTAPCDGEACKGPISSPPALQGPGSGEFAGPGNEKPKPACKPGFVRKHGKCVKKNKHKRHQRRSAKRNRGGVR